MFELEINLLGKSTFFFQASSTEQSRIRLPNTLAYFFFIDVVCQIFDNSKDSIHIVGCSYLIYMEVKIEKLHK